MSYYPGQAKTSKHIVYTLMFTLGIGLTVGLYYVKTRAQSAKAEVARLERLVTAEKVALNVLRAEIAYLESPERVSAMARVELGLAPIKSDQIIDLRDISDSFDLAELPPTTGGAP